jgi:hypothetical protein
VLDVGGAQLVVARQPLVLAGGKLSLGPVEPVRVTRQIDGRGFADAAAPGDVVSLHWNWVCEVLAPRQQEALVRHTEHHLRLANQTM